METMCSDTSPANQKPWLPRICGGGHSLHVTLCRDSGIAKKPEIASEMVTLSSWAEARCWTRTSMLHPIAGCLSPWHLLHPNISLLCSIFMCWSSRESSLNLLLQIGQALFSSVPLPSTLTSPLLSSITHFLLSSFSLRSLADSSLLLSLRNLSNSLLSSSFLSSLSSRDNTGSGRGGGVGDLHLLEPPPL